MYICIERDNNNSNKVNNPNNNHTNISNNNVGANNNANNHTIKWCVSLLIFALPMEYHNGCQEEQQYHTIKWCISLLISPYPLCILLMFHYDIPSSLIFACSLEMFPRSKWSSLLESSRFWARSLFLFGKSQILKCIMCIYIYIYIYIMCISLSLYIYIYMFISLAIMYI